MAEGDTVSEGTVIMVFVAFIAFVILMDFISFFRVWLALLRVSVFLWVGDDVLGLARCIG